MISDVGHCPADSLELEERFTSIETDKGPRLKSVLEEIEGFPDAGKLEATASFFLKTVAAIEVAFFGQMESEVTKIKLHFSGSLDS
jgi:hypothetical protein